MRNLEYSFQLIDIFLDSGFQSKMNEKCFKRSERLKLLLKTLAFLMK